MNNDINFFNNSVERQILNIHTAYLGKVLSVNGNTARLQPLSMYKALKGSAKEQSTTTAVIPSNIKFATKQITYRISDTRTETQTVVVPANLAVGDIVFVGVCDRDITFAKNGIIKEATPRHHNINDGVILRVL